MAEKSMYQVVQSSAKEQDISLTVEQRQKQIEKLVKKTWEASKDDEGILKYLANRFSIMDSSRPLIRDGDLRYKQFLAKLYYRRDGLANVNLPIEFATIENKLADELVQVPIVDLQPQTEEDVHKVSLTRKIWDFVWNEADTNEELVHHKLCKNIFGTSGWHETIVRETYTRYEPKINKKTGKIEAKPITETRSYLKGVALDIRDWWIDPVYSVNVAEDCFIRERDVSYDTLLQRGLHDPNYNKDAVLSFLYAHQGQANTQSMTRNAQQVFTTEMETTARDNQKFSLMHYYNKRTGQYIVTDDEFQYVFRCGANPYPHGELPIAIEVDHTNYRSIYGRGECELLESTKYERNMIRNQFLDSVRFSNTVNIMVGGGVTFEDQEMIGGVARIWNFQGDAGQIQMMKPPSADSGLAAMEELLSRDATWITGVDNNALTGSPDRTAYQARLQEQQKQKRIFMSLRNADFFYNRMGRQRLANIQFFLPYTTGKLIATGEADEAMGTFRKIALQDTQATPIMGIDKEGQVEEKGLKFDTKKGHTEFLELTPKMIKSNITINVTTPSTTPILRDLNRAEMQELMNMVMAFMQFPQGQELVGRLKLEEILETQFESLGHSLDEYIMDEDEMESPEKEGDENAEIMGMLPTPPKLGEMPGQAGGGAQMGLEPQGMPQMPGMPGGMPAPLQAQSNIMATPMTPMV